METVSFNVVDEEKIISNNEKECKSQGGEWAVWGEAIDETCNLFTKDAGKECSDSIQCEAYCVVDLPEISMKNLPIEINGVCSARTKLHGCHSPVENGFVNGMICS